MGIYCYYYEILLFIKVVFKICSMFLFCYYSQSITNHGMLLIFIARLRPFSFPLCSLVLFMKTNFCRCLSLSCGQIEYATTNQHSTCQWIETFTVRFFPIKWAFGSFCSLSSFTPSISCLSYLKNIWNATPISTKHHFSYIHFHPANVHFHINTFQLHSFINNVVWITFTLSQRFYFSSIELFI